MNVENRNKLIYLNLSHTRRLYTLFCFKSFKSFKSSSPNQNFWTAINT